jgi:hypothetical protein
MERAIEGFRQRFWNDQAGCLYDVVDADHQLGRCDAAIRPNQIFAVGGLPIALIEGEQAEAQVMRPAFRAPRGEPRVRALFDNWLQWLQDASSPGGCLFLAASTELDDKEGRPRDFLVGMQRQLLQSLAKTARLGIEAGHFRGDLDCDQYAFELYGLLLGHSHFRRLLRDPRAESRTRGAFERLVRSARVAD